MLNGRHGHLVTLGGSYARRFGKELSVPDAETDMRSPLSLQSAKLRKLLFCRIDHPRFRSCLFGNCELCLRFGGISQPEQSFDQRCTDPIFLLAFFVLAFAPYAFCEQLCANSDDALAHASSLNSIGDGVLAAELRGAAVEKEGK